MVHGMFIKVKSIADGWFGKWCAWYHRETVFVLLSLRESKKV